MKPLEILVGLAKIPMDYLMGLVAFLCAYQLRTFSDFIPGVHLNLDLNLFPNLSDYVNFSHYAVLVLIALFALNQLYTLKNRLSLGKEIGKIIIITMAWLGLIIGYFFAIREFPFSRLALLYSWALTIIFIVIGRLIIRLIEYIFLSFNVGKTNLLFIGNNDFTNRLAKKMIKSHRFKIVGLIDNDSIENDSIKTLGTIEELEKIVKKHKIEEIIQTKSDLSQKAAREILNFCREHHLGYSYVPDILGVHRTNVIIETLDDIPVLQLKPTPLEGWGRVIKRCFDLGGATLGLIIFSPIFAITALAIKLNSKGTVFFKYLDDGSRAKRVGQYGKLFNFCKFRTMYANTHNLRYTKLADQNIREGSPLVKIKNDPRVTKVGKFLRKTSIDELPQLINVLKGEMSLVGPRAHLPEEVEKYANHHKFVLTIKPGITGLAQISGRSDLNFEDEIKLDTYYIENWSLWLDLKILAKTWLVVFQGYKE